MTNLTLPIVYNDLLILTIMTDKLLNNNNNNDRLTAFDPGQPG